MDRQTEQPAGTRADSWHRALSRTSGCARRPGCWHAATAESQDGHGGSADLAVESPCLPHSQTSQLDASFGAEVGQGWPFLHGTSHTERLPSVCSMAPSPHVPCPGPGLPAREGAPSSLRIALGSLANLSLGCRQRQAEAQTGLSFQRYETTEGLHFPLAAQGDTLGILSPWELGFRGSPSSFGGRQPVSSADLCEPWTTVRRCPTPWVSQVSPARPRPSAVCR